MATDVEGTDPPLNASPPGSGIALSGFTNRLLLPREHGLLVSLMLVGLADALTTFAGYVVGLHPGYTVTELHHPSAIIVSHLGIPVFVVIKILILVIAIFGFLIAISNLRETPRLRWTATMVLGLLTLSYGTAVAWNLVELSIVL